MSDYDNPLSDNEGAAGNDDATIASGINAAGFEPPTPEAPEAVEVFPSSTPPAEPVPSYEPYSPPLSSVGSVAVSTTPPIKDNKKTMIIVVVVVLLLLCCCCILISVGGWFYGDQLMEQLNLGTIVRGLMLV